MGKSDYEKLYKARMDGMWNAYEVVKSKGIDELYRDLKIRGFYGIDTRMPQAEYEVMIKAICDTVLNNVLTCSAYTLVDKFGWSKNDLQNYKKEFDKITDQSFEWDFMGQQYVSLTDYAKYLNDEYDLDIDVTRVSQNEDSFNSRRKSLETAQKQFVREIINKLKINGYGDASAFLEGCISEV